MRRDPFGKRKRKVRRRYLKAQMPGGNARYKPTRRKGRAKKY